MTGLLAVYLLCSLPAILCDVVYRLILLHNDDLDESPLVELLSHVLQKGGVGRRFFRSFFRVQRRCISVPGILSKTSISSEQSLPAIMTWRIIPLFPLIPLR